MQNSTDDTRGEPLAQRARKRKAELEKALEALPTDQVRARGDIELAIGSIDSLLTGDTEHLSAATAADLNRVLELNKHLAESPVAASPSDDTGEAGQAGENHSADKSGDKHDDQNLAADEPRVEPPADQRN